MASGICNVIAMVPINDDVKKHDLQSKELFSFDIIQFGFLPETFVFS